MRLRRPADPDAAPPSRGPVAAYAGILDGRHLWLAVGATPGTLALRDHGSGELVPLRSELPDDDPAYRSVRADLAELPPPPPGQAGHATYEVVLKGARLLPARAVWSPPLPEPRPTRTPPTPDRTAQFELERSEDGHLRVVRRPLPAAAELATIGVRDRSVHLRIRPADGVQPGTHLLLLDTDDQVLTSLPVTGQDGLLEALVGVDDLPAGYFGVIRFALGTPESWMPIRRRHSDLADPNGAVLLPELFDHDRIDDVDAPRARFRWSPDSLLTLRVIDPDEATAR